MIAVMDYGMGNLHSVAKALEAVGADVRVTGDPKDLEHAEKIVLPGVGSFAQGIKHLSDRNLAEALSEQVLVRKKPFLGICLGMQLAAREGEEEGPAAGLGWLDARVIGFRDLPPDCKVPHMGWNDVTLTRPSPLFKGITTPTAFYFVHSYYMVTKDPTVVAAVCDHGGIFTAAVSCENIHLVQFHPEKSQEKGLKLLENFVYQ